MQNKLIGCSICINKWFCGDGGLGREPRGHAQTFQFKGIDDFLKGFEEHMADPSAEDEEESLI